MAEMSLVVPIIARLSFFPTLAYNLAMEKAGFRKWYNYIDTHIILGALPFRGMTKELVEVENVRGVLSMNETYELQWLSNQEKDWKEAGVEFLQLSTVDFFQAPTQCSLHKGVEFIQQFDEEESKGNIYVHCKAGRTRSATLVACYLMKKYNISPTEAVSRIKDVRSHIRLLPHHNEALDEYYQTLQNRR